MALGFGAPLWDLIILSMRATLNAVLGFVELIVSSTPCILQVTHRAVIRAEHYVQFAVASAPSIIKAAADGASGMATA